MCAVTPDSQACFVGFIVEKSLRRWEKSTFTLLFIFIIRNCFWNIFDFLLQRLLITSQCGSTIGNVILVKPDTNTTHDDHVSIWECYLSNSLFFILPTSFNTLSLFPCRICAAALQCVLWTAVVTIIAIGVMHFHFECIRLCVSITLDVIQG